jgi:glycosyltransferase involved in cell wall biosynthesis
MTVTQSRPVVLFTGSFVMGGMEAHVAQLGDGLIKRGFDVAAIVSSRDDIEPLRAELDASGVKVHSLAEQRQARFGPIGRFGTLIRTIREYPGCVLHIHSPCHAGGDLVLVAARLAGAHAVVRTEHGPPDLPPSKVGKTRVWLRDRLLSRIIWVSKPADWAPMKRVGRNAQTCTVVNNCIDLTRFSPDVSADGVREEFGIPADSPIIGTVARLGERRKGIPYFLEMAATVLSQTPTARFLIIGDGHLRPELERYAAELGIQDRVVFTGDRQDIPRLLAAMQVYVMPSLMEGCQYTLLEAMAMAKPIVSTPAGIGEEVVAGQGTGILVPYADSAALAAGVLKILADPVLARDFGRQSRALMVRRFALDTMVDNIARVYREVA